MVLLDGLLPCLLRSPVHSLLHRPGSELLVLGVVLLLHFILRAEKLDRSSTASELVFSKSEKQLRSYYRFSRHQLS